MTKIFSEKEIEMLDEFAKLLVFQHRGDKESPPLITKRVADALYRDAANLVEARRDTIAGINRDRQYE